MDSASHVTVVGGHRAFKVEGWTSAFFDFLAAIESLPLPFIFLSEFVGFFHYITAVLTSLQGFHMPADISLIFGDFPLRLCSLWFTSGSRSLPGRSAFLDRPVMDVHVNFHGNQASAVDWIAIAIQSFVDSLTTSQRILAVMFTSLAPIAVPLGMPVRYKVSLTTMKASLSLPKLSGYRSL